MPTGCLYPDHHGADGGDGALMAVIVGAVLGIAGLVFAAIAVWHFAAAHAVALGLGSAGAVTLIGGGVWFAHRNLTVVGWSDTADEVIAEQYARLHPDVRADEPEPEPVSEQDQRPAWPQRERRPAWGPLTVVDGGGSDAA